MKEKPVNNKQERAELHKAIWRMAEDCRGSVDGWDFKQYVLGMLFYRFISENLTKYINKREHDSDDKNFDYAKLTDKEAVVAREEMIKEKGFYILPSELFVNVVKHASNDENLNETLARIFRNIENSAKGYESEDDLKGLFDEVDLSSKKIGDSVKSRNERLVKLLNSIANLSFAGDYNDNQNDTFGDAYEYLMSMYASSAGKSGGEFFTPQEVGELLARIVADGKTAIDKVYDPCCGSGGLLLKFAKVLGKDNVDKYYGQDVNLTSHKLCRMNMFLHDINYHKFDIKSGDTLLSPQHAADEPFDAIVSNPPYSIKWEGDSNPLLINDPRFSQAGVLAPKSKADFAFTLHMLSWLSQNGTCGIVEFPGILYRAGAEQNIRKYLVDNNFIDTIIQMPSGLFFGVGIATCILIIKKNKKDNNILFIDASQEFISNSGRGKNDQKVNMLSPQNIQNILDLYRNRTDKQHISHLATYSEVKDNDFNLSVNKYVEKQNDKEEIDINVLNNEIKDIVKKQSTLRVELDKIVSEIEDGGNF